MQERVERAILAKDLFDSNRSHKRRQDHGHEYERSQQAFAREDKAVADDGERQRDEEGERRCRTGKQQ